MEHGSGRYVPCSLFLVPCSGAERERAARRGCWAARSVNTPRKTIRPPMANTSISGQVRMRRRLTTPMLTVNVHTAAMIPGTNHSTAKVEAAMRRGGRRIPRPRSPTISHSRPAKPRIPRVRSAAVAWLAFHRVRKALISAIRVLRPRGSSSCSSSSVNSYTSSSTLVPRRRRRLQRSRTGSEGMLLHRRGEHRVAIQTDGGVRSASGCRGGDLLAHFLPHLARQLRGVPRDGTHLPQVLPELVTAIEDRHRQLHLVEHRTAEARLREDGLQPAALSKGEDARLARARPGHIGVLHEDRNRQHEEGVALRRSPHRQSDTASRLQGGAGLAQTARGLRHEHDPPAAEDGVELTLLRLQLLAVRNAKL